MLTKVTRCLHESRILYHEFLSFPMLTITGLSQLPPANTDTLVAVFLAPSHLQGTPTGLLTTLPLGEAQAQKGKKHLLSHLNQTVVIYGAGPDPTPEQLRRLTHQAVSLANEYQMQELALVCPSADAAAWLAITEAAQLSHYQFQKYFKTPKPHSLVALHLIDAEGQTEALQTGQRRAVATCIARDLVNEPVITLTAEELARQCVELGKTYGFSVEVLDKARIEELGMGGLLAVNSGSMDPPTFTIMEYAPAGTENDPPVVLMGKGVVYDTGGLSLKPTANSMDFMKADMGGAAAVIGAMCGVAQVGTPQRVIGLVPATDNRPGQRAYTPGDVIRMYDGSTVEVLNTDAEGRMIMADALHYAKQYDPKIVVDLATLTGAQVVAIGSVGLAMMSTADVAMQQLMHAAGDAVYERVVSLPLWDEYREMLRSDIADLKNIGGREAGCITAGKFLEHFTDYPWIHLDIAGPAWLTAPDSYRGKGGSGVGVRLLMEFIERMAAQA